MARKNSKQDLKTNIHDFLIDMKKFNESQEPAENGCINWTGPKHRQGYGFVFSNDLVNNVKKMLTAHKVTMMIKEDRRIASTELVLHTCSNMACVNPDHLIIGTREDMMKIMKKNGRTRAGKSFTRKDKKQNRNYGYTIPEMFFIRDNSKNVELIMKQFNLVRCHAHDVIGRVVGYRWLDHFNRDGTLKKEFADLYAK